MGHRAVNCANNRADNAESAGERNHRQRYVYEGRASASVFDDQYGQQAGGSGSGANSAPDPSTHQHRHQNRHQQANQPQQPQQYQWSWVSHNSLEIPRHFKMIHDPNPAEYATALEAFRQETGIENPVIRLTDRQTALEMQRAFERSRELVNRSQWVDSMPVPVTGMGDPSRRNARVLEGIAVTQSLERSGERMSGSEPVEDKYIPAMGSDDTSGQTARETQDLLEARSLQRFRERVNRSRPVDVRAIPVLGRGDRPRHAQPHQQQQAGHGALPGARNAQPIRTGAGLLGNFRVEKPGAARGQRQQQRQRTERVGRGGRPVEREEDEPQPGEEHAPGHEHHVSGDDGAMRTDSPSSHDPRSADHWRRQQPDSPGTGGDDDVDFDLE